MTLLAITQGDCAGIGPEIIAKAFRDAPDDLRGCFAIGDLATLRRAAQCIERPGMPALPVALITEPAAALSVPSRCLPVLQLEGIAGPQPFGQISAAAGQAAAQCVVWAAQAALRGDIAGLVTAPLHKEALHAAGVHYPGHTELLQAEAAAWRGVALADMPVRMMLASDELRTVLVSIHMSMRAALDAVTLDNVLQTLLITHAALLRSLGRAPRIAVAGLNPHAGEGGVFMRARNTQAKPGEFDVVLAMYHDQGLIPVKYLGVDKGVNVTLGLPLVRTSPDHGTAFDIAGQGVADASSLIEAIRMAKKLA